MTNALKQHQIVEVLLFGIFEQGVKVKLSFIEQIFDLSFEGVVDFLKLILNTLSTPSEILVSIKHLQCVVNLFVSLIFRFLVVGVNLFPSVYEFEDSVVCLIVFEFG